MIQNTKPASLSDELEDYRSERLRLIRENLQPIVLEPGPKVVLHVVPAKAFENMSLDLKAVWVEANDLKPLVGWGSVGFNFDGLMMVSRGTKHAESYVQVFHTGIVEAVDTAYLRWWHDKKFIPARGLEDAIIECVTKYSSFQNSLGVTPPLFVMLSLLGVKGYSLTANENYGFSDGREIDRDDLLVPALQQDAFELDLSKLLRPVFDRVWNAGGFRQSLSYDQSGNRKAK